MNSPELPIPPGEPIPHRKIIREWLLPLSAKTTLNALTMLVVDYIVWAGFMAGAVLFDAAWQQLLCSIAAGFCIGRLFIIGHDACHQSLTPHRTLNKWLGRIAFLPSLTPFSLWDIGHNVVHHGYTNLKGFDFVWAPLTKEEYSQLGFLSRMRDRLYRSGWAPGIYYMIEIWWKKMIFPTKEQMPTQRAIFIQDNLLVCGFAGVWLALSITAALLTNQSVLWVLFTTVFVPFMFWCAMIGFVVYVHHTHVKVSWHDDRSAWSKAQPFVSTTVHLTFPFRIGALMHHIMEHTAHHVDMSIPLYKLKAAQSKLEELLPERIIVQPFSWSWYFETAKSCKLYDFTHKCWTDYKGHFTSVPHPLTSSAAEAN